MQIPLHQIDQHVEPRILQRGQEYFENGYVGEYEEIEGGLYETVVEGTEPCSVSIRLDGDIMTDYDCTCPYDMGPVCKHVVAFAFSLLEELPDINESSEPEKAPEPHPPKKATVAEQVTALLETVDHEELQGFVKNLALRDAAFRRTFVLAFTHLLEHEPQALYVRQVKAILDMAGERDGYIGWRSTQQVYREVATMLTAAHDHAAQVRYHNAIYICCAVMEELVKALEYTDDSSGHIGDPISEAFSILHDISCKDLPDTPRTILMDYCLRAFKKGLYKDWDWHMGLMDIAMNLAPNASEADQIRALLEGKQHGDFDDQRAQVLMMQLMQLRGQNDEAEEFLAAHLTNPDLRKLAINKAIEAEEFDKAIQLAQDGIEYDAKDRPGLVNDWYEHLLEIAQLQKNKEKTIEYARHLYLDSRRDSRKYYSILKNTVGHKAWSTYVEGLVDALLREDRWYFSVQLADLYIAEEWWPRLLELIQKDASLHTIEEYEEHLSRRFPNELSALYRQGVLAFLEENVSRKHYRAACHYIRRIKEIGGREQAQKLIRHLQAEYPRRRALLEELERVGL